MTMVELLDDALPQEDPIEEPKDWKKYRKRLLKKMTYKRLLCLAALIPIYVLLDYYWGHLLMMGEFIWGFFFYIPVSILYAVFMLQIDFSEYYWKRSLFALVLPFVIGMGMFLYILWLQIDIQGSTDPRAATAIIP